MKVPFNQSKSLKTSHSIESLLNEGEAYDDRYGTEHIRLTQKDIEHLMTGGGLSIEICGEYTCILILELETK